MNLNCSRSVQLLLAGAALLLSSLANAAPVFTVYEAAGANAAAVTAVRDAFRTAIGGGSVAGANGSFGGLRREINWDGVPDASSDPNPLQANFFNTVSPRGAVFSTPGTGFLVSANAGALVPIEFGFGQDFTTFSAQRLFTAVNSNIVDVNFFLPGTTTAAATTAFGLFFIDVDVAGATRVDFFDPFNNLLFSRDALAFNNGLSFLAVNVTGGTIGRVRITSGSATLVSNGVASAGDLVVMDDFIYAEPLVASAVSEPGTIALLGLGLAGIVTMRRRASYLARQARVA